ncbi:unnamed protein product [Lampetra fluviatilis]
MDRRGGAQMESDRGEEEPGGERGLWPGEAAMPPPLAASWKVATAAPPLAVSREVATGIAAAPCITAAALHDAAPQKLLRLRASPCLRGLPRSPPRLHTSPRLRIGPRVTPRLRTSLCMRVLPPATPQLAAILPRSRGRPPVTLRPRTSRCRGVAMPTPRLRMSPQDGQQEPPLGPARAWHFGCGGGRRGSLHSTSAVHCGRWPEGPTPA